VAGFGVHEGHAIHAHDHRGQDRESCLAKDWCSGRWLCVECATVALPKGVWFAGPRCRVPRGGRVKARG
jgi:hypothetical protein